MAVIDAGWSKGICLSVKHIYLPLFLDPYIPNGGDAQYYTNQVRQLYGIRHSC